MTSLLLIALGGALGALSRYGLSQLAAAWWVGPWPLGTLLINLAGSALIGVVFVFIERAHWHADWRYVLSIGFLGAFTTFSTFALETVELLQGGQGTLALAYMLASALGCVCAAWAGLVATRTLLTVV